MVLPGPPPRAPWCFCHPLGAPAAFLALHRVRPPSYLPIRKYFRHPARGARGVPVIPLVPPPRVLIYPPISVLTLLPPRARVSVPACARVYLHLLARAQPPPFAPGRTCLPTRAFAYLPACKHATWSTCVQEHCCACLLFPAIAPFTCPCLRACLCALMIACERTNLLARLLACAHTQMSTHLLARPPCSVRVLAISLSVHRWPYGRLAPSSGIRCGLTVPPSWRCPQWTRGVPIVASRSSVTLLLGESSCV